MEKQCSASLSIRKILAIITIVVVLIGIYEVGLAIYDAQNTGTLVATSSKALLTLSQPGHQQVTIGTSSARVRLQPGSYTLIATDGQTQATKTVSISKKTLLRVSLPITLSASQIQENNNTEANKLINNNLPFSGPDSNYVVSYKYTYTASVANPVILITLQSPSYKQAALDWIQALGYNPADLNIQYVNS